MTEPISVIIPVYNAERYVRESLDSVLGQDLAPAEVIVIDDGSQDATADVVASFGKAVRYERQVNAGPAVARNRGLTLARCPLLAFQDADDLWLPGKLRRQIEHLAGAPDTGLVFTHLQQFISPDLPPEEAARRRCPEGPQPGYLPGTLVARREVFERVGPFRETREVGELIAWLVEVRALAIHWHLLPEVLYRRRIHADNLGVRERAQRQGFVQAAKLAIERRREAARQAGEGQGA